MTAAKSCQAVTPCATANPSAPLDVPHTGSAVPQSDACSHQQAIVEQLAWVRAYDRVLLELEEILGTRGITMRQALDELRRLFASPKSVYFQRNQALEEVALLKQRIRELEKAASMACHKPAEDCECAGCLYAEELYGGDDS